MSSVQIDTAAAATANNLIYIDLVGAESPCDTPAKPEQASGPPSPTTPGQASGDSDTESNSEEPLDEPLVKKVKRAATPEEEEEIIVDHLTQALESLAADALQRWVAIAEHLGEQEVEPPAPLEQRPEVELPNPCPPLVLVNPCERRMDQDFYDEAESSEKILEQIGQANEAGFQALKRKFVDVCAHTVYPEQDEDAEEDEEFQEPEPEPQVVFMPQAFPNLEALEVEDLSQCSFMGQSYDPRFALTRTCNMQTQDPQRLEEMMIYGGHGLVEEYGRERALILGDFYKQ